jgi:hypothetical protein
MPEPASASAPADECRSVGVMHDRLGDERIAPAAAARATACRSRIGLRARVAGCRADEI